MNIELKLWEMISLILAFGGFVFTAFKILLSQIDRRLSERFAALETARHVSERNMTERFETLLTEHRRDVEGWRALEREVLTLKADLPVHYVRKEDYVRGQTVIEAKLDALHNEIKITQLKGQNHAG